MDLFCFFFQMELIGKESILCGACKSIWQNKRMNSVSILNYKISQQSSNRRLLPIRWCIQWVFVWVFCVEITFWLVWNDENWNNWLDEFCWMSSQTLASHCSGQLWQDWVRNRDVLATGFAAAPTLEIIMLLLRNCMLLMVIRMCSNVSGAPKRWSRFL